MKIPKALEFLGDSLEVFEGGKHVVYFLIRNEAVIYVGVTQNLGMRISSHRISKVFDAVFFVRPKDGASALAIESAMIRGLKPRLNKAIPPKYASGVALRVAESLVAKSLRPTETIDERLGELYV